MSQLEAMRKELEAAFVTYGPGDPRVIALSQELDQLIAAEMRRRVAA